MTMELEQAIGVMKEGLLARLGDEVDLIFQFGSYGKGSAHRYSDLDICYVPVHESTWTCLTVMVAGVLIDLYPMHWLTLESMADFDNVSATLLLENRIVYQRCQAAADRFLALPARLLELTRPAARPAMLKKAQQLFQTTGYEIYLLRVQAGAGHWASCQLHAQHILATVLHCLMICNQTVIDTRKMAQVLALRKLPAGLAETVERIAWALMPDDLLSACETLLQTTRDLLLEEQRAVLCQPAAFPEVFNAFYPELKAGLQKLVILAERQDRLAFNHLLASIDHEMSIHLARAETGIQYAGFNSLEEYEQDLAGLGFPSLQPPAAGQSDLDPSEVAGRVQAFDRRLQEFLTEHGVGLNSFDSLDQLRVYLQAPAP